MQTDEFVTHLTSLVLLFDKHLLMLEFFNPKILSAFVFSIEPAVTYRTGCRNRRLKRKFVLRA